MSAVLLSFSEAGNGRNRNYLPPKLRDKLLDALAKGSVEDAAKALGVTFHTAYAWDSRRLRGICACGDPIHKGLCRELNRVTGELRAEILAERDGRQLSTHVIAGEFGISHKQAIAAVVGHPLRKRRKIFDPTHWNSLENRALRRLYPKAPWAKILQELPGRTKLAIERRASELGVRRRVKEEIDTTRLSPVVAGLRARRIEAGINHRLLAAKAEINVNTLRSYETGHVQRVPKDRLARWKAALDYLIRPPAPQRSVVAAQPASPGPTGAPYSMFQQSRAQGSVQRAWRRLDLL